MAITNGSRNRPTVVACSSASGGRCSSSSCACSFLPEPGRGQGAGCSSSWSLRTSILITLYLRRVNPDVIAARVNRHEGTKGWDRLLLGILIPAMVSILPVAALDDSRYHWFHVPWWVCVLGYALLIAGMAGLTWAESVNKFFEPTVRIQTDRGHKVIDAGPYAIVRHPGYAFGFLLFVGMPLALGSLWALIPVILSCLLLVLRTVWEDQTLRDELAGYEEYTQRVRYRLVPGVW